ncbi:hypothetical protein MTO96_001733 [Rhipicephalus appendiculatus]
MTPPLPPRYGSFGDPHEGKGTYLGSPLLRLVSRELAEAAFNQRQRAHARARRQRAGPIVRAAQAEAAIRQRRVADPERREHEARPVRRPSFNEAFSTRTLGASCSDHRLQPHHSVCAILSEEQRREAFQVLKEHYPPVSTTS